MDGNFGIVRINLHKIKTTLDANNKIYSGSHIEHICSVSDNGKKINANMNNGEATIVHDGYTEGSEVDMWLFCLRSSEGGAICEEKYVQADEDTYQRYLDMQP